MAGPTTFQPVTVREAWDETPSLRAIRLALPADCARAHRRPGQLVKAHTAAGEGFFALASAPDPAGAADLLVKRGGRVADAVIAAAVAGGAVALSSPFGDGFPVEEAHGRDVLLFAAGSGIAPIRAVVQHFLRNRGRWGRVTLFYGQRLGGDFAYRAEHAAWERGGVRVVLCPSRADDLWEGFRGRVQVVARSMAFAGSLPAETVAFVAGMATMVEDVRRTLAEAGMPPERVFLNH
jgi:sulfhydrogenase subunit gamma (sulfur reductase)